MGSSADFNTDSIVGESTTYAANVYSSYDNNIYYGSPLEENISTTGSDYYEYYIPEPIETTIVLVILGCILLVGIVGNILVLIIIATVKSMHTMVNKCLFSLALADLVVLTMLPINPIQEDFTDGTVDIGKNFCHFLMFYDRGAVTCSVLTFYYVSMDRYFALCYPLKSRGLLTGRKTYIILVAIWVLSLTLSYPYLHNSGYEEVYYNNASHYFCYLDIDANNWMKWYDTCFALFTVILPIPVFVALYGRMIYRIKHSVSKLNSGTAGNDVAGRRGRNQVVVLLLTVVVIYIVSQLPYEFLQFFDGNFPAVFSFGPYDEYKFTVLWIARILIYVNSAANPVIYFSLSTNFRQVFCCFRKKSPQRIQETQSSSL